VGGWERLFFFPQLRDKSGGFSHFPLSCLATAIK